MKSIQFKPVSVLILFFLFVFPAILRCETIILPLHLDYPMLRSLVIYKAFTDKNQTAVLTSSADPCRRIVISEPAFSMSNQLLRFETRLHVEVGAQMAGNCLVPVVWDGYLELYQRPLISPAWMLSFESVSSELLTVDRKPTKLPEIVWEFIAEQVYDYLGRIQINMAPPVMDAQSVLFSLFPKDADSSAKKLIDSMRPGNIVISPNNVRVEILADSDTSAAQPSPPETDLSPEELQAFASTWEAYDAFLVQIIQTLVNQPLTPDERQILFHALIDTRYRFVAELAGGKRSGQDFVREQFILVWNQLSPVFRNHLGKDPSKALLAYIAFFSASDALAALDRVGPELGIEISRDGLIRLARLLSGQEQIDLSYSGETDSELRAVLGMGEPIPVIGPAFDQNEIILPESRNTTLKNVFKLNLLAVLAGPSAAWAGENISPAELKQIKQWIAEPGNLDTFVQQVQVLLDEVTDTQLKKSTIPENRRDLFRQIVSASAWQESCFRQYLIEKGKITYLRSYNNTSVGLMQVNERVWRSLYDLKALRWDIRYNAQAGCEILDQYLTRYALPKGGKSMDDNALAGSLYAMYNSGPGDFSKFQNRLKTKKLIRTDTLFREKFLWVKQDQWNNISKCLGGG
ncbi:MAG: lytic transglycosylase domain-containing protein [Desulfatirhabdiaceae bacterium]